MPVDAEYLWQQGKSCLKWAQECFDLTAATHLRVLGEDLLAKAEELDAAARRADGGTKPRAAAGRG